MNALRLFALLTLLGILGLLSACGGATPRPTPQPVTRGIGGAEDPNAEPVAVNVGNWTTLPGAANEIAIGAGGDVFVVGIDNNIYKWNGNNWDRVGDVTNVRKVAAAPDGTPWVVRHDNSIARLVGGAWQAVPGEAQTLAIGAGGDVFKTHPDRRKTDDGLAKWNGTGWDVVNSSFSTRAGYPIAVGPDGSVYITYLGAVERFVNGAWRDMPFGAARGSISIGANGDLWTTGAEGTLKLEGNNWVQVTTNFVGQAVAVAPNGIPWVAANDKSIRRGEVAAPPAPTPGLVVVPSPGAPTAPATATRANVTLLCKFADNPAEPRSREQVQALHDGPTGISAYIQDQSYGAAAFTNQTFGWYTLPRNRSDYIPGAANLEDYNLMFWRTTVPHLFQDCTDVATQNGVKLPDYGIISIFINTDFRVAGLTVNSQGAILPRTLGDRNYMAILYDSTSLVSPAVIAHELGHLYRNTDGQMLNTGGHPASQWDPIGSAPNGRGDDVGGLLGYNAYTRDRVGWMPASHKYLYDGGVKQITLARLTQPGPTGFRMAQIPIGNTGTYYTVEARVRVGFDGQTSRQNNTTQILPADSVVIHLVNPNDALNPDRAVLPTGVTFFLDPNAIWPAGSAMRDTANNIQIRVDTITQDGATVTISPAN